MTSKHPKVAFFVTCLVDLFRPNVGFASIKLLREGGCEVDVPAEQTCCGQPAYNNGDLGSAKRIARRVIETFSGFQYVVVPSGSCAGMIKRHFPTLFEDEPEWHAKASALADRTHELVGFLTGVLDLPALQVRYSARVTYHDSCSSLRELGICSQARELLSRIEGLTLEELPDSEACCGFGGTFCVKFPEISTRMVTRKVENISATGADTLLSGDLGCLLNIAGRLRRLGRPVRVYHLAEVLAGMTDVPSIAEGEER